MTSRDVNIQCRFCSYTSRKDCVLRHMKTLHTEANVVITKQDSIPIAPFKRVLFQDDKIMAYCFNCHSNKNGMGVGYNISELEVVKQRCKDHNCVVSPLKGRKTVKSSPIVITTKIDLLCYGF